MNVPPQIRKNIFKEDSRQETYQSPLKVLDRRSNNKNRPIERPLQSEEFERMQMMFHMFQQNQQMGAWQMPRMNPWNQQNSNMMQRQGGHQANFMQMKNMYMNNPRNMFAEMRGADAKSKNTEQEIMDDEGVENSEMNTRVSELEKMIDMIEKANTQLSSLVYQSNSDLMNFGKKKKKSMCSAQQTTSSKKEINRISKSADVGINEKKIKLLKSRLDSLTRKTITNLNSVLLEPKNKQIELSIDQSNYSYTSKNQIEKKYGLKMKELKKKIENLSLSRKVEMEKIKENYQKNCKNMEKDFRELYNNVIQKKKLLNRKVDELEKEKYENLEKIKKLLETKKKKEMMITYLSKTLLLSKNEIEGLEKKTEENEMNEEQLKQDQELLKKVEKENLDWKEKYEKLETKKNDLDEELQNIKSELIQEKGRVEETRHLMKIKEMMLQNNLEEIGKLKESLRQLKEQSGQEGDFEKENRKLERENKKLKIEIQDLEKKTEKYKKKTMNQNELIDEYEKELLKKNEMVFSLDSDLNKVKLENEEKIIELEKEIERLTKCLNEMEEVIAESVDVRL
jgi:hypothetical protein